jgi:DNA mismatch repair protein MutL
LAEQGLLVEPFGPAAVAVQGVPLVLTQVDAKRLLRELLAAGTEDGGAAVRDRIAERFHSMACRAAVMSGDRLTEAEIEALLQEAATLEHPHNCPHGRPTVLTFGTAELERYFRRRC